MFAYWGRRLELLSCTGIATTGYGGLYSLRVLARQINMQGKVKGVQVLLYANTRDHRRDDNSDRKKKTLH